MFVKDGLTVDRTWETPDGFLGFSARFARTGIQHYDGAQIDPEGLHKDASGDRRFKAGTLYPVQRDASEVFADRAMGSFIAKPITNDHPSKGVNVDNWSALAKGAIGEVLRDGQYARMSGLITDRATIADYRSGKRELSGGYQTELIIADGVNDKGEAYVARQTAIDGNHCALVDKGRAGSECAIRDSVALCDANPAWMADLQPKGTAVKKIVLDGLQVDLSDADAVSAAITKLQDKATVAETALADAVKAHDKALAAKDAEIDDLKTKTVDQAKIDALADAKAAVVADAKKVAGDKLGSTAGKTVPEVRRMAVAARLGDAAVADKSDDYIEARFDTLKDGSSTNDRAVVNINPASQVANDSGAAVRNLARASQF
jgi:hypothetical protein